MIELICDVCGNTFFRNTGEYNRSVKKGRKSYCSRKCTGKVVGKNLVGHRSDYDISQHSGNRNDKYTFLRAVYRSTKSKTNKNFDLTLDDLLDVWENQEGKCVYTGWDLETISWKKRFRNPRQISIDRIDCNLGYTKENIQLVCMIANLAKNNFTDDQLFDFCKSVIENKAREN
jgi:hypothetical protein